MKKKRGNISIRRIIMKKRVKDVRKTIKRKKSKTDRKKERKKGRR